MSDQPAITPEYIASLKSREERFRIIAEAIDVEADLRDNTTIKALMAAAKLNFDQAVAEIVEISPHNAVEISRCLVNIKTFLYMKRALEGVLTRGRYAEQQIKAEDSYPNDV